jgi:hypothetical protein
MQVSLKELGAEPGNHAQIEQLLVDVVNDLIEEAESEQVHNPTDPATHPLGPTPGTAAPKKLPLVRLRVDYTGYTTIHTMRFGHRFVNRVANPQDILLWSKSSVRCGSIPSTSSPHAPQLFVHSSAKGHFCVNSLILASMCCERHAICGGSNVKIQLHHVYAACSKTKETAKVRDPRMTDLPADLDDTQIEDLIADFAGSLEILPGAWHPPFPVDKLPRRL